MIIAKSPLRISLFGGGSDLPDFFNDSEGCVVGSSINLWVYLSLSTLAPEASESLRFTYRVTESVKHASEIQHPVVKTVLEEKNISKGLNIGTMADVPGGSGLGGSSAFTAALIAGVDIFLGKSSSPREIAEEAIKVESEILGEPGGWQDQFHTAIGGFRSYKFTPDGVSWSEELLKQDQLVFLEQSMLLVHTGISRNSSIGALKMKVALDGNKRECFSGLSRIAQEYTQTNLINLTNDKLYDITSSFLLESWKFKKDVLGEDNQVVEKIIQLGVKFGATSFKLLGAGDGGYVLFMVPPDQMDMFILKFSEYNTRRFRFINEGTQVTTF
jgi:D-glycero-alpha-D-manno-heptose-7-phosphate kinase